MATALTVSRSSSPRTMRLLVALGAGVLLGTAMVAAGSFGLVNDWGDSNSESTRTVAITAAALIVVGFILYRVGRGGFAHGASSTALRAFIIGILAVPSGIALFWSGAWAPVGATAIVLGGIARPEATGRSLGFAIAAMALGAFGIVAGFFLFLVG